MELYLFRNNTLPDYLKYITGLAITRGELERLLPDVTRTFVGRVKITCPERMFLQLDGEPYSIGDDREYEFMVLPKAMRVLAPPRKKRNRKQKTLSLQPTEE